MSEEDSGDTGQASRGACRAYKQQNLAAKPVDQCHPDECSQQVHRANCDRLQVRRHTAEAGRGEDVVEVVENGINAAQLIECADGDGEKDRFRVPQAAMEALEQRGVAVADLQMRSEEHTSELQSPMY